MGFTRANSQLTPDCRNATVEVANSLARQKGIYELARKRFQNPSIRKRGAWWVIDVRIDAFEEGNYKRKEIAKTAAIVDNVERCGSVRKPGEN